MSYSTPKPIKWPDVFTCLGLLAVIGLLDYLTGYNTSFFLFYLVPVIFALHRLGMFFAFAMCVLSALVWLFSNMIAGQVYTEWLTPGWNTVTRILVFSLVVSLLVTRKKLEGKVRQGTDALSEEVHKRTRLEKEVLEASEREQRKIGSDLHDSLGQHLTATAMAGKVLSQKLTGKSMPEAGIANQVVGMVEEAIELTRTLARSLHPVDMKTEGLADALQELADNISKAFLVTCKLECPQIISLATADANMHLYRITQEAISNAIRHGQAKNIIIRLEVADGKIMLAITDDGVGLPADAGSKNGMGLNIMDYRAGMIGANLQVARQPTRGTRVTCTLPLTGHIFSEAHAE
jgi:signal transduction histidine kinase